MPIITAKVLKSEVLESKETERQVDRFNDLDTILTLKPLNKEFKELEVYLKGSHAIREDEIIQVAYYQNQEKENFVFGNYYILDPKDQKTIVRSGTA